MQIQAYTYPLDMDPEAGPTWLKLPLPKRNPADEFDYPMNLLTRILAPFECHVRSVERFGVAGRGGRFREAAPQVKLHLFMLWCYRTILVRFLHSVRCCTSVFFLHLHEY